MGIETYMELTTPNNLLILANIVLIIIAFLLLLGLRKSTKNPQTNVESMPKKERKNELSGIADIKPEEFKAQKFEPKKDVISVAPAPIQGIESISTAMKALVEPLIIPEKTEELERIEEPEKIEEPQPEVLETDEFELEDELPEIYVSPSELEIPPPVKEEKKIAEKPAETPSVTPEPDVKSHVKEKEMPPEELKLPLELTDKAVENAPEMVEKPPGPEIPPAVTEMDKLVDAVEMPPEPGITKQVVEKAAEVVAAPPEPEMPPVLTEMDKLVEAIGMPPESEMTKPAAEEEKPAEIPSPPDEPEFKVFKFDKEEEKVSEVSSPPDEPEVKVFKFDKEEEKVSEASPPPDEPEVKLFPFDKDEKKPEAIAVPASPDILTSEKPEITATVTASLPGEPAVPERVEKKAKRKSLF